MTHTKYMMTTAISAPLSLVSDFMASVRAMIVISQFHSFKGRMCAHLMQKLQIPSRSHQTVYVEKYDVLVNFPLL